MLSRQATTVSLSEAVFLPAVHVRLVSGIARSLTLETSWHATCRLAKAQQSISQPSPKHALHCRQYVTSTLIMRECSTVQKDLIPTFHRYVPRLERYRIGTRSRICDGATGGYVDLGFRLKVFQSPRCRKSSERLRNPVSRPGYDGARRSNDPVQYGQCWHLPLFNPLCPPGRHLGLCCSG